MCSSDLKPMLDEVMGVWVAPFIMATINTRNVHRSNFLMNHVWGSDFVYDEMIVTGPGEKGEAIAKEIGGAFLRCDVSSEADGPREWRRWQRRFPEILEPLQVAVIGFETAGGEHLFRVQGGPLDEDGAKNVCAKIKAEGAGCFVIRPAQ